MKNKLIAGLLAALVIGLAGYNAIYLKQYEREVTEPVEMMIATDLHYLTSELIGDDSFFHTPAAITDGKPVHYSEEMVQALLDEAVRKQPKALILSGDLTLNGSVKSHRALTSKLRAVEEAGVDVLVIPGNHDIESTAFDYNDKNEPVIVESVDSQGFIDLYGEFGPDKAISRDETTFSYIYEANPWLRVVMLDANCFGRGSVKDQTLVWLEEELKAAKKKNIDVMMVSHQNLYAHNQLLYFGYQFYNYDDLMPLLEEYGVICNFSGHIHVQSIVEEPIPEIVTAAYALHNAQYGEIVYDGESLSYEAKKVDVDVWAEAQGITDENLLNFSQYGRWYFEEVARLQVYEKQTGPELTQDEKDLLANTFAEINSAYFMGEAIDVASYAEGIGLWKGRKGLTSPYIETMVEAQEREHQSLTIPLNQ